METKEREREKKKVVGRVHLKIDRRCRRRRTVWGGDKFSRV